MKCELAPAELADAPALRELLQTVITQTFGDDPALYTDVIVNVNENIDFWLALPQESVVLKAVAGGAVIGMVQVKRFWNLCSLYVHPHFQNQGVGRELLEAASAACAGRSPRDAILLNAAPGAIEFYRRLGFVEREATRPLPPGALAMQRPL
jgi:ribosomal protein S18 acetylase RimI-like enzyme